ncbi:MAG: amino acid permease [Candidatus Limnocylindrales bacterium]
MATATAGPEVFVRKSSGLVRVMSPSSAFVYNILTMGLIFPWTYLWAPGALPGGQLVWGILLAMVLEIPIALAYVWLSTALPRSGGDYVFQSRVLGGGIAFTVVMSGFVIWILQWVALSGWLLSYLGFAALFLGLGATLHNTMFLDWAGWFASANGIIVVSILNAGLALWILSTGFRNYIRLQRVMWIATLVSFGTMLVVLITAAAANVPGQLNAFSGAAGGSSTFVQDAITATTAAGINLNPPFSLLATLLIAPIAWTSLQWATYSSQQNGEIKDARSFRSQVYIIIGSLLVTGVLLAALAFALEQAVGSQFLYVAGAGYWSAVSQATINGVYLWPNIIAIAISASPIVVVLISFGFILNAHQIVHNCYIGMSRVMVAMSLDRLLPEWVSRVSERFHTPVNAHLAYFVASIPVIILYNEFSYISGSDVTTWASLTLGVTFACGYVFVATALAGALLPFRAKALYEASPGAAYKIGGYPLVTVVGIIGFVAGVLFELLFIFNDQLGLTSNLARTVVLVVLIVSAIWYLAVKYARKSRGINVEYAFKEIPPE